MGNTVTKPRFVVVNTASCENTDPTILPPMPAPPPPGGAAPPDYQSQLPPVNEKFKFNPGTVEDMHKRCKDIFPIPIEGAKVVINKGLNQGFQVTHSLSMSAIQPSGYRFGATYVGDMLTPTDPSLVLIGDLDPSGNLNAQAIHCPSEPVKLKFATQVANGKYSTIQTSMDYRGRNWTLSAGLGNPNLFTESGIGVLSYLQGITPELCAGLEIVHQRSPQIPETGHATIVSACARYSTDINTWSGFAGMNSIGLCYYRRINEELQIGVDLERNFMLGESVAQIGYQYDLPKANFTMKAMVDTNWTVTAMLEKRLLPMPFTFSLCGSINHVKNQFRLGCSMVIGG
jgi:mitochondrial import receptor subunit TOM40